jgi:SAM-dependent methyltransferase
VNTGARDVVDDPFGRQAGAFARSPLHRDPARLRRLIDAARPRAGETALDIACGPGIVAAGFASAGVRVIGIDASPGMLREAVASGALLARAAAEQLPFADGAFDLVVCRNSFHHFRDPVPVMAEIARVLRGGGRAVIEDMVGAEDLPERDAHDVIERLRDGTHVRTIPRSEFVALARRAGLRPDGETVFLLTVDFEEWVDRAAPSPSRRARARRLVEARGAAPAGAFRSWFEGDRLRFERPSLLLRAVRA